MARTAVIEYWRDLAGASPDIIMTRYIYTAATNSYSTEVINIGTGGLGAYHPPAGTIVGGECDGEDGVVYYSTGGPGLVTETVVENASYCCTVLASDFQVVKTNNTSLLTPNGTIKVTSTEVDINDYEVSIDDGDTYHTAVDDEVLFEDLPAGSYTAIIRTIVGACSVTVGIVIVDNIVYPPPIVAEETQPDLYSPVFFPIVLGFKLVNNQVTIKEDVDGTYLEVDSQDEKDYLGTLPFIKIFDNEDYEGTYKVESVDDVDDPQKFYINATFTTEQNALFVPFDRQVFHLFAEVAFNNYKKIADITVYPDPDTGEYKIRLEGFLQGVFEITPPVNNGDEIALLRNYYVVPRDFDMEDPFTTYKAVFAAVESLTPFLEDLTPLGPAPINFINEQTQRGYPVLFSVIDTTTGRIKNVTSSYQTNIVSAAPEVYIPALPFNAYDFEWTNPAGAIADLQVDPALPSWITLLSGATDKVKLLIDTGAGMSEGGDYDGEDYSGDDYLTGGPNAIVGCYEFEFSDGVTPLFTLQICIFPIQKSNEACIKEPINIAWVNREGGWSSYVFDGKKTYGKDIGDVRTYKKGRELKRSSVENVYDTVEVNIANKSIKDLIFISSLRQSIQAFVWSESTLQWSVPIVIDKQSFPIYTKPFKQLEVEDKFTFRYAEEVVIQSQ